MRMIMKKIFYSVFSVILIAMTAFSCTMEEMEPDREDLVAPEGYLSFSASFSPDTKTTTSIDGGVSVTSWDIGDEISIVVSGDATPKTYVAEQAGETTTFAPKTDEDKIRRTVGDVYTLTASYGGEVLAVQNIDSRGINDCQKPLAASLDGVKCDGGNVDLTFSQTAALLDFKFAAEDMTLTKLIINTGSNPGQIIVNFTDGLDLRGGNATAQVVIASLAFKAVEGISLEAYWDGYVQGTDTPYRRIILLGKDSQDYKVGKHTRLNMKKFRGVEITTAAELRELALCINRGWNIKHFQCSDNYVRLANDIDISYFAPWEAIGNNGKKDLDAEGMDLSYVLKYHFDGQGHTISGLTIDNDVDAGKLRNNYDLFGLFGVVNANIIDLTVSGKVVVRSSNQTVNLRAGGLAAVLMPGKTISNCTSNVAVGVQALGRDKVNSNDVFSATSASVHKWQRVGGIVGECRGNLSRCVNNGTVSNSNGNAMNKYNALTNAHYGGIAGQVCNYEGNNVLITECVNNGNLSWAGNCALAFVQAYSVENTASADTAVPDQVVQGVSMGGVIGTLGHRVTSDLTPQAGTVTISACSNKGSVQLSNVLGCNVGGVVGRTGIDEGISIMNCSSDLSDAVINGAVCSSKSSNYGGSIKSEWVYNGHNYRPYCVYGGVIGAVHSTSGTIAGLYTDHGSVRSSANCYAAAGGVIGFISHCSNGVSFYSLENKGTAVFYNSGSAGTNGSHFGGVIGMIARQNSSESDPGSFIKIFSVANRGDVSDNNKSQSRHSYGGIVGYMEGTTLVDAANYATISARSNNTDSWHGWIGGIVGVQRLTNAVSILEDCWSYGTIKYDAYHTCRGFGLGEAECTKAYGCRYGGVIGDSQSSATYALNSGNVSTYSYDGVRNASAGAALYPLSTAGSDTGESDYYSRIGAKADNWQWAYHDAENMEISVPDDEPNDLTPDPVCSLGGTYASIANVPHPRLLMTDERFIALKSEVNSSEILGPIHSQIMSLADKYTKDASQLTRTFDASERRILAISKKAVSRIFACAYAYKMTGEAKYLEKVKSDLVAVCSFSDWNATGHMLDAAEMAFAVAIGYDWCYEQLPGQLRISAHAALRDFAITQEDPSHNYSRMTNNWNPICYAGMVAASIAIYEKDRTISAAMIESALANNPRSLTATYGSGNHKEGYSYWAYGTSYQALLNTMIKRIFGTCGALETTVDFANTGQWLLMMEGPSGKPFSYSDCTPVRNVPQYAMWYIAGVKQNLGYLYNEYDKLADYSDGELARLLPMVPVLAYDLKARARIKPQTVMWPVSLPSASDVAPVLLGRSFWNNAADPYIGIKGGKADSSHSHMDAGSFVFDAYGYRWSEDLGSCDYADVESKGITLSNTEAKSSRWHVFLNNRFSHSTLMKQGTSYVDGAGAGNYDATAFAPITEIQTSVIYRGAKVDLTDVMKLSTKSGSGAKVTREVIMNTADGSVSITDYIKNPTVANGGKNQKFWSRIVTSASVDKQSGYIELTHAGCSKKYRYTITSGTATLVTWPAENPGGRMDWDVSYPSMNIIGCSFDVAAGTTVTITTKLTPYNN